MHRRRKPKSTPATLRPPPPHPFLSHLKCLPDPILSVAALLSAPPGLRSHPFASCVLYRLARARLFPLLFPLLASLHSDRTLLQPQLFCALIRHLSASSRPDAALHLFHSIPFFTSTSIPRSAFNSLLLALVSNARLRHARLHLSTASRLGVRPNVVSYNVILKGMCRQDGHGNARKLLDEMLERGVRPSVVTFNTLISFACQEGDLDAAVRLRSEMGRLGLRANAITYALLMRGLCNAGQYGDAKKMLFDMEYHGCPVGLMNYGVLMSDRARAGDVEDVKVLLLEMRKRKLKPDNAAYNILVKCLCDAGRVEEAYNVLVEMQMKGTLPSAATYRVLVDGCCRAEDFELGLRVFSAMLVSSHCPRMESFERLIKGLCEGGRTDDASFVLEQMGKRKMRLGAEGWSALVRSVNRSKTSEVAALTELAPFDDVSKMK